MITPQLEQALYIRDLIDEKESIKFALSDENYEDIWLKSATECPDHVHSELEPNYLELLSGLNGFDCLDDAPHSEIDKLRKFILKKVDLQASDTIEFLNLRLKSVKDNISHLKKKFIKDWQISYKEALKKQDEEQPVAKNLNLDDILDKINDKGMKSLTEEEQKFLKNNSNNKNDKGKNNKK